MDLSVLSTVGAGAAKGAAERKTLADNYDAFLQLLTTQLRNQSPTDPLDTNQFTQQLVQYASVEQELRANENLVTLQKLSSTQTALSAVSYVGATVGFAGATAPYAEGSPAQWTYDVAQKAQSKITIRDANSNVVWTGTPTLEPGGRVLRWNGDKDGGGKAPAGRYTVTIEAKGPDGTAIPVTTEVSAKVRSVDLGGDEPVLGTDGGDVPLSSVKSVSSSK